MRVARTLPANPDQASFSEVGETLTSRPAFQRLRLFDETQHTSGEQTNPTVHYHLIQPGPDAPATGQAVAVLKLPHGTFIVTVERNCHVFVPHGNTILAEGDIVTLFATPQAVAAALATLTGAGIR